MIDKSQPSPGFKDNKESLDNVGLYWELKADKDLLEAQGEGLIIYKNDGVVVVPLGGKIS